MVEVPSVQVDEIGLKRQPPEKNRWKRVGRQKCNCFLSSPILWPRSLAIRRTNRRRRNYFAAFFLGCFFTSRLGWFLFAMARAW